jgi:hypothetical protein
MATFRAHSASANGHANESLAGSGARPARGDGPLNNPHLAAPLAGPAASWDEDALRRELARLRAEQAELLAAAGQGTPPAAPTTTPPFSAGNGATAADKEYSSSEKSELTRLAAENARLRARLADIEREVAAALQEQEQLWAQQQREYEALLEEKSEVIRQLHRQLQELKQEKETAAASAAGLSVDRLKAWQQELQNLQAQLERERQQLREDEQVMEEQMKQMELALSRERVELARQRAELQRLHQEFQHELELAARDEKLRDRLLVLQRRHQEVMLSKGAGGPPRPPSSGQLPRPASTPALNQPPSQDNPPPKSGSGLLRRLFGRKE